VKNVGIESCYIFGNARVGGLVGYNNGGTVSGSYSTGRVDGSSRVGGLVGYNMYGTVNGCYSTGEVKSSGNNVGGLVRDNKGGTVSGCYWDTETSGMITSAGGKGKTTARMKQQVTFIDWDFVNVWGIEEGVSYPYLLWQVGLINPEGEGSAHEGTEEGVVEGTPEGKLEGAIEGIREGIVEGEGEGGGGGTDKGCGCFGGKSLGEAWWKYLVDFVLFGLVISLMSGMGRRQKRKE